MSPTADDVKSRRKHALHDADDSERLREGAARYDGAQNAGRVWREHGALAFVECLADDVKPGKARAPPQGVLF